MSNGKSHGLTFHSDAVDDGTLIVGRVRGREAMSECYSFDVRFLSTRNDIDDLEMIQNRAFLTIRQALPAAGGGALALKTLHWHGMIEDFRQLGQSGEATEYQAVLRPRLWKLSRSHGSRIFQDQKVIEIVTKILEESGLTSDDFEFRTSGSYPTRGFVMQYEESDLDFVHRWLEHEGIFYYFEQTEEAEKIIFADNSSAVGPIAPPAELEFNAAPPSNEGDAALREPVIRAIASTRSRIPGKVVLKDYNWRTPDKELKVEQTVSTDGEGTVYEYNNHFKDESEGRALAAVRAEEILCRERVFAGESDGRTFRAGHTFTLANHYRDDFNVAYLLTSVEHTADQKIKMAAGAEPVVERTDYENGFSAITADIVFRPACETPWPSIKGIMHAKVDADGSGDYAEINEDGCYRVKLPLDLSDNKGGQASRFVRMAQPYAGEKMGMHFPLHKNAEVLLTFVDGDPDRPVISGAVPNRQTLGPVVDKNQTQCAIQTGGNNTIVMEDQDGNQRIKMSTPHGKSHIQIGSPNSPTEGIDISTENDQTVDIGGKRTLKVGEDQKTYIDGEYFLKVEKDFKTEIKGSLEGLIEDDHYEENMGGYFGVNLGAFGEVGVGIWGEVKAGVKVEAMLGGSFEAFIGGKVEYEKAKSHTIGESEKNEIQQMKKQFIAGMYEVVAGDIFMNGLKTAVVRATTGVEFRCAGSRISMTPKSLILQFGMNRITLDPKGIKLQTSPSQYVHLFPTTQSVMFKSPKVSFTNVADFTVQAAAFRQL